MQPFRTVTGIAAPLLRANIDTDMIIPVQRLVGASRDGLGPYGFERFRYLADGSDNPEFPLNRKAFRTAPILLAGENFGCGSSREGAVWTLMGMGLRCVIAPSFGDIFHNNCFQNGLLPVRLPEALIRRIAEAVEASPGNARVTVDLERQEVITPWGEAVPFAVDARKKQAMLEGLDEIALTKQRAEEIAAWQARDRAARPWAWDSVS
ncbi:3-isopropylmalate dehydratase small subunit [Siccirubricoccus deserti]|uniref:3-isopropylmalate dehydratase small subunit n=1 Tax=Siccirubricoccus deserti TaxID=2013562 RepID=A0A9X0R0P3_9PROT|nr:3-isopropylmalate dehydratase small subunit [Siccirubricoccus deserti]MBC4017375.1 3-isopropylmalate dehydratase small subunit [Siccirubricoccus deserti]GGC58454.1 3-isopropylmalate dehydratase small subunit [Siccirubricoccus deserti]